MKPVNCGCGGEAVVYVTHWWGKCYVCQCDDCGMSTKPCDTEAEAITAWNKAMGERTAMVESYTITINPPNNIWKCGNCGQQMCETHFGNRIKYCSNCGARLEWDE